MIAEAQVVENIVLQVKQLSPEYRLRLIQRITETLIPSFKQQSKPIQFGKYKSDKTLCDLKMLGNAEEQIDTGL